MADITVTATSVQLVTGTKTTETAGATITAGQPLYRDSTDSNQLKPAQADTEAKATVIGIALCNASDEQPCTYAQPGSVVNMGATLAVGATYVVSDAAAGGVAPEGDLASGDYVTILGVAQTAANLLFDPIISATAHA